MILDQVKDKVKMSQSSQQQDFIEIVYEQSIENSQPNSVQQINTYSTPETLSNPNEVTADKNNNVQDQQTPQNSSISLSTEPHLITPLYRSIPVKPRRSRLNPIVQSTRVKAPDTVLVYDRDGNEVSIKDRKKQGVKHRGEKFAEVLKERTDARRTYTNSFISKLIQYKNRISDDALLVLHDKDREEKYFYTTDRETFLDSNQQILAIQSSDSPLVSPPPVPSFDALAQSSPSKRMRIDNELLFVDKDSCRICKIKHQSKADVECDSPWMGCNRKDCGYWVHSVCKGFADATEEEIDELNFYCPEHNTRAKNMLKLKGKKQKVSSTQTKENAPPPQSQKDTETSSGMKEKEMQPVKIVKTRGGVRRTGERTRGGVQGTGVRTRGGVRGTGVRTRGGCARAGQTGEEPTAISIRGGTKVSLRRGCGKK